MRGVGVTSSAISFANALFTGQGCAAAIDLRCEVIAEVDRTVPGELPAITVPEESDTPLVRAAIASAVRSIGPPERVDVRLTVRSAIPPGKGLKSSSAVSCAVLEAIPSAWGIRPDPIDIARRSAEVSRAIGLSATGAFDDACAALMGGVALTDNAREELLRWEEPDPSASVLLWVPDGTHVPSTRLAPRFRALESEGRSVWSQVETGAYLSGLEHTSELVEKVLGYRYRPLRERLRAAGASACGVSGLGPALAAIVPSDRADAVEQVLAAAGGRRLRTRFRPRGPWTAYLPDGGGT